MKIAREDLRPGTSRDPLQSVEEGIAAGNATTYGRPRGVDRDVSKALKARGPSARHVW